MAPVSFEGLLRHPWGLLGDPIVCALNGQTPLPPARHPGCQVGVGKTSIF